MTLSKFFLSNNNDRAIHINEKLYLNLIILNKKSLYLNNLKFLFFDIFRNHILFYHTKLGCRESMKNGNIIESFPFRLAPFHIVLRTDGDGNEVSAYLHA